MNLSTYLIVYFYKELHHHNADIIVGCEFKKLHFLLFLSYMRLWRHLLVICGTTDTEAENPFFFFLSSQQKDFVGLSFPTISSVGPNGAIIHYRWAVLISQYSRIHLIDFVFFKCLFLSCFCRPLPETNRTLSLNEVYLIDSGAQYL